MYLFVMLTYRRLQTVGLHSCWSDERTATKEVRKLLQLQLLNQAKDDGVD